ncbi:MAG: YitT family protein [Maribacter sp.]|nr:YitT family protein [Maribacter sp.]
MKNQENRSQSKSIGTKLMIKDSFFIISGIFSAAFGLESFLFPNRFIDGGATGISLLFAEVTDMPLSLLIILVNIPFLVIGLRVIGRTFTIKASLAILGLALVLATVNFPEITQDKLLVAVFGGFFLGAGIGLSIRGGGVLDGTEVLAIFLSRKMGSTIGDVIVLINLIIFLAAAYLLSIETALYSMLTYLAASKTLDFVVEGIEEYTGVTIISNYSEEIRQMIIEKLGRGVTIYNAKGGFRQNGIHNHYEVLYTVITRLEIRKLNIEITKIDSKAFVVMNKLNDTRGGMIKKRIL